MVSSQSQAPSSNTTSTVTTNNCSQGEAASTSPTTTTLFSSSSQNGEINEKQKKKKKKNKNCSQYGTLKEMATDINDGVPSKTIEKIIFKNMMKIMLEKFNEQKKN